MRVLLTLHVTVVTFVQSVSTLNVYLSFGFSLLLFGIPQYVYKDTYVFYSNKKMLIVDTQTEREGVIERKGGGWGESVSLKKQ